MFTACVQMEAQTPEDVWHLAFPLYTIPQRKDLTKHSLAHSSAIPYTGTCSHTQLLLWVLGI